VEGITIGPMEGHEQRAVVDLLARALRDNPSTAGMFGPGPRRRLRGARAIYSLILANGEQPPLVARADGRIVGAAAVSPPGTCFYRRSQSHVHRIGVAGRDISIEMPAVPWSQLIGLLRVGWRSLERAGSFARSGMAQDPAAPHWHVELVGVEPDLQGRGIGAMLMEAVLRQSDAAGELAYLETDTPENVEFYRHRGFEVAGQDQPLGVPTWYMER
jgi:GNAT superfamily N-acetyltransferase